MPNGAPPSERKRESGGRALHSVHEKLGHSSSIGNLARSGDSHFLISLFLSNSCQHISSDLLCVADYNLNHTSKQNTKNPVLKRYVFTAHQPTLEVSVTWLVYGEMFFPFAVHDIHIGILY